MPRKSPKIVIGSEDRPTLLRWANSRILSKQLVDRAKMILDSEVGKPVKQIASELNTYPNKIIHWRQRYVEFGLEGLGDNPRSGRLAKYDEAFRNRCEISLPIIPLASSGIKTKARLCESHVQSTGGARDQNHLMFEAIHESIIPLFV